MLLEGISGLQRLNDGDQSRLALGTMGEAYMAELHAKYAVQTLRGNGFVFSTTTAASITALGNNIPSLFNPLGSNIATIIDKVTLQTGAVGVAAVSGLQYGWADFAGANIGTAAPIPTATFVAGQSLCLGSKRLPKTMFAPAAITFTTAPALLAPVGLDLGSTATETPYTMVDDVDGRIVMLPGTVLQLGASTATSKTFNVAFWVYEVALPSFAQ